MKIEGAIKQFKEWESSGWSKSETPNSMALYMAIVALEKQIPKEPIEKENGWYYCPTCNTKVPASANYCCGYYNDKQGCGQALKWEKI